MQTTMIVGWAIAFVFFIVVEVATPSALVSIWFGFGALISMFFAIGECPFWLQLVVFVVASILLLVLTRPLARKLHVKPEKTNYELDVGKTAVVTEDIDNEFSAGRVKLGGVNWEARSEDGSKISAGSVVTVKEVDGAKLIVAK